MRLVVKWIAGTRDEHPLIIAFLEERALHDDRLVSSRGGGRLQLCVDHIEARISQRCGSLKRWQPRRKSAGPRHGLRWVP